MGQELGFAGGQEDDLKLALLALDEGGAADLDLLFVCACVGDFERTVAADLKAIVVDRTGDNTVGAKAGTGVVNFKELNVGAGAVLDGGVDMVRVAGGGCEETARED